MAPAEIKGMFWYFSISGPEEGGRLGSVVMASWAPRFAAKDRERNIPRQATPKSFPRRGIRPRRGILVKREIEYATFSMTHLELKPYKDPWGLAMT
jgi:hypothetical protein